MAERDDFYRLDDDSFGDCLKIVEAYDATRFQIESFFEAVNPGEIKLATLNALEGYLKNFGASKLVKRHRGIIAQIKKEKFPSEAE